MRHQLSGLISRLQLELELLRRMGHPVGRPLSTADELALAVFASSPEANVELFRPLPSFSRLAIVEDEASFGAALLAHFQRDDLPAYAIQPSDLPTATLGDQLILADLSSVQAMEESLRRHGERLLLMTGSDHDVATAFAKRITAIGIAWKPIAIKELTRLLKMRLAAEP